VPMTRRRVLVILLAVATFGHAHTFELPALATFLLPSLGWGGVPPRSPTPACYSSINIKQAEESAQPQSE
jgi:hypothetical protein